MNGRAMSGSAAEERLNNLLGARKLAKGQLAASSASCQSRQSLGQAALRCTCAMSARGLRAAREWRLQAGKVGTQNALNALNAECTWHCTLLAPKRAASSLGCQLAALHE